MDLILFLMISIGISVYKISRYGEGAATIVGQTSVESNIGLSPESNDYKVGNNLMLKKEKDAFMFILHQLGVVKK